MTITVNIETLIQNFKKVEGVQVPEMTAGMRYIHTCFFQPLFQGQSVNVGDIDFSAFSLTDIKDYRMYYYNYIRENRATTGKIAETFSQFPASAQKGRAFF